MGRLGGVRHDGPGALVYVLHQTGEATMERVTLRIPEQQIEEVERMVETGQFPNRSEAIRSAVRAMLNEQGSTQEAQGRTNERTWAKV